MPNKMLVDASHPEETRVVVVRGNRIEEFDFESQDKKQLKGNIYLARVTRVEPSLQAAFVEYGGNRHGFLAFSEIHPDYYQIPVADRQALLRAEAEEHAEDDDDGNGNGHANGDGEERQDRNRRKRRRGKHRSRNGNGDEALHASDAAEAGEASPAADGESQDNAENAVEASEPVETAPAGDDEATADAPEAAASETQEEQAPDETSNDDDAGNSGPSSMAAAIDADVVSEPAASADDGHADDEHGHIEEVSASHDDDHGIEVVGAEDAMEEMRSRRKPMRRQYKIQEVIKRRQILLVQVVKEERGNKGAALTTYLSLAGRYSVLMPNTARGGGISRKITNAQDRKRLKEVVQELEVPQGMGVILRTAGESRTKAEIKRDYEYLMRMWENVRTLTLQSVAPALVYEEGSLIKRSVRDLYNKDIDEILVAGEDGYREAKDFMRMLMPSHAKVVQPYRDATPIFARNGIEAQLDRMLQPQVTLKSGGYIIINQTEALVAIDVNSGRSTKEHNIEDTALQTNLEAAEEVARQLRLRDLAGLIVIDFIDMEENRNNRAVEKRLKDHLKNDRARIQVGRISHFGLLEMSRQRIRASVLESTMKPCPHCGGTGHVRSDSSVALLVLRAIEEFLLKDARHHITVRTPAATAFYVLNHKRSTLVELEQRFGLTISFEPDESLGSQHYAISRGAVVEKPVTPLPVLPATSYIEPEEIEDETVIEEEAEEIEEQPARAEQAGDAEHHDRKRRKRRRRRGGKDRDREHGAPAQASDNAEQPVFEDEDEEAAEHADADATVAEGEEGERKKRRRGKRGGRRNRKEEGELTAAEDAGIAEGEEPEAVASEPEAEAPAGETAAETSAEPAEAVAETAPVEEAPAEKPKRARRTTRAKKAAAEEAVSVSEPVAAAEPEAVAEEKPAKKPRASRRKAAAAAEPTPAPEAVETPTEPEAAAEETAAPAPVEPEQAKPDEKPQAEEPQAEEPQAEEPQAEEPQAEEPQAEEPQAEEPQAEGEDKPKRTGWWQRKSFF